MVDSSLQTEINTWHIMCGPSLHLQQMTCTDLLFHPPESSLELVLLLL